MSSRDDMPRGIDVASHQGAIDWRAVAASGIGFGFTKATGGAWYTNPTLAANWRGMRAAGIRRGAYHYAFESSGQPFPGPGPEAEADFFLAAMQPLGLESGDMLALDIEEGSGLLGEWALRWLTRVEAAVGFPPLVYTGAWFSVPHGFGQVAGLGRHGLWLAAYQEVMPAPPPPWSFVAFWQHSSTGRVPGVAGNVDLNVFNGPADHLALYGKPGAPSHPSDDKDALIGQLRTENDFLRAEVVSLKHDLGDRNSKLGAVAIDYAGQLRALADRLAELKPGG